MSLRFITDIGDKDLSALKDQLKKKLRHLLQSTALFRYFAGLTGRQYRPEKYYMRGPGPKAKAKGRTAFTEETRASDGAKAPSK